MTHGAGDPLPDAVASLFSALAAADPRHAATCFTDDAVWAVPPPGRDESAPRVVHLGPSVGAAISADPHLGRGWQSRVCVVEGDDVIVEGDVMAKGGVALASFGLSLQLAGARIARGLLVTIPPAPDEAGTDLPATTADLREVATTYLRDLRENRFTSAAGHYAPDGVYLHPPYEAGGPRVHRQGRADIEAGLVGRGPRPWYQHVDLAVQRGAHLLLEGQVYLGTQAHAGGEEPVGTFLSSVTADERGRILRYQAFYTAPAFPRHASSIHHPEEPA